MSAEVKKKISDAQIARAKELAALNLPDPDHKQCTVCNIWYPIQEFQTHRVRRASGVRHYRVSMCGRCLRDYRRRQRQKKHREYREAERKAYHRRAQDIDWFENRRKQAREWARIKRALMGHRVVGPWRCYAHEVDPIKIAFRQEFSDWYFSFKESKEKLFRSEYDQAWKSQFAAWLGFESKKEFDTFERSLRRSRDRRNVNVIHISRILMIADCEHLFDVWWPSDQNDGRAA